MVNKNEIKMRVCKDEEAVCKVCGKSRKESLEIFEVFFTEKQIIRICDLCNDTLLNKSLKASCMINHRVKSNADMRVIRTRNIKKDVLRAERNKVNSIDNEKVEKKRTKRKE